jgi:hypothetical protein
MCHPKLLNHELTYYIYMVKMKTPLFHDGFLGVNTEPGAGVVPPPHSRSVATPAGRLGCPLLPYSTPTLPAAAAGGSYRAKPGRYLQRWFILPPHAWRARWGRSRPCNGEARWIRLGLALLRPWSTVWLAAAAWSARARRCLVHRRLVRLGLVCGGGIRDFRPCWSALGPDLGPEGPDPATWPFAAIRVRRGSIGFDIVWGRGSFWLFGMGPWAGACLLGWQRAQYCCCSCGDSLVFPLSSLFVLVQVLVA